MRCADGVCGRARPLVHPIRFACLVPRRETSLPRYHYSRGWALTSGANVMALSRLEVFEWKEED